MKRPLHWLRINQIERLEESCGDLSDIAVSFVVYQHFVHVPLKGREAIGLQTNQKKKKIRLSYRCKLLKRELGRAAATAAGICKGGARLA